MKNAGILVRHGSLLDKLIRRIPVRFGHYEQVRIGTDLNHSRFTLRKPHQFISCDICLGPVRDDQIFVDQYENTICQFCFENPIQKEIT